MARTASNPRIINRSGRFKLAPRRDPYWHLIAEGKHLGYRKGAQGGTWIARAYDPATGRKFQSLGTADDTVDANGNDILSFEQAQEQARTWFARLAHNEAGGIESGPYSVAQAMEDYVTERERVKRKPLHRTRMVIKAHILPTLGKLDVSKLTHGKLKAWRDNLETAAPRKRSKAGKPQAFREFDPLDENAVRARQATVNRVLTTLKAALNYGHTETKRIASDDAWIGLKSFRNVDVPKIRFLTPAQATALVNACSFDFRQIVQAALLTGCRYGELKEMTVASFDAKNASLFIAKSKNEKPRHVLLNAEGTAFFNALTHGKKDSDWLFVKANGKPWQDSEQKRPMDAACAIAKLEQVTFHILRHTYASQLAMNTAPMKLIADQLGHKSTRITERHYAHLGDDYKREVIQRSLPLFGFVGAQENSDEVIDAQTLRERKTGRLLHMAI